MLWFARQRAETIPARSSSVITIITLAIPIVAGIVDIICLSARVKLAYTLNIVLIGFTLLFFLFAIGASIFLVGIVQKHLSYGITVGLIYLVPIGLLIWLLVEFVRRTEVKMYFSQSSDGIAASE